MDAVKIKIEDLSNLNPSEITEELLSRLKEREKDIIIRRHGLKGGEKEILEGIGKIHNLTRERVRQIESAGLRKIRESRDKVNLIALENLIKELIAAHGGMMEKDHLFEVLAYYGLKGKPAGEESAFRNFYNFIILKILDGFEEVNKSDSFSTHIKLTGEDLSHWVKLIGELKKKIGEKGSILLTKELFSLAREAAAAAGLEESLDNVKVEIDLSPYYQDKIETEPGKEKNILYSIFKAAKAIDRNVFGHWGLSHWPEIKPRNLNEKIYLVLKNETRPMHFAEIAKKIDGVGFDKKTTNIASAHNELILDDKFILVGRGMYGLAEWGLKQGTVAEIISEIIDKAGAALTREEIIDQVLKERMVKKTTIALALANKERFMRDGNSYRTKEPANITKEN
ncbi:MAG: HTH domain-containing protein [Patescibacteria group bacterium]|jgi:DNA-binding Lrp family transcriptional regulator